jgi:peptide/nickel transport system ATP-binding protein
VSAALLTVEGLGVRFPLGGWPRRRVLRAVHDVSFEVRRGEILALVGESGSGKSTIGRALARLQPLDAGRVTLVGEDSFGPGAPEAPLAYRRRVQLVFQDPFASLNPVHPVGHAVARPLLIHGKAGPESVGARVAAALQAVGLSPGAELAARYPHQLSGGQRQRVAIARALASEPDLVVADEPTSMLDVSIRTDILGIFRRLRGEGRSVLLVTHDLASARLVSDRVAVLYAGQLLELGPAAEVLGAPRHPYTRLLVAAASRGGLRAALPAKPGAPPVVDPAPGCPFAARCPDAVAACRAADPPAVAVGDRLVRCTLAS